MVSVRSTPGIFCISVVMFLISDSSVTSITATASNWPLTGNDSVISFIFLNLAAISFFGDFTSITALTNPNLPPLQLMFQC